MRVIDALELTNSIVEESVKEALRKRGKVATSETINSIRSVIKIEEDGYAGEVYGAGGLKWIESGRAPGSKMPPSGSLLPWMRTKGIEEDKEFVIRRSIAVKGIKPTTIIADALKETHLERLNILSRAVANETFKIIISQAI